MLVFDNQMDTVVATLMRGLGAIHGERLHSLALGMGLQVSTGLTDRAMCAAIATRLRDEAHQPVTVLTVDVLYGIVMDKLPVTGCVSGTIGGVTVAVKTCDAVGHVIQDWIGDVLKAEGVRPNKLSQEFPDYYFGDEAKPDMLEIKTFMHVKGKTSRGLPRKNAPAFDIANFYSYVDSLRVNASKLNASYLVLGYEWHGDGNFTIDKAWMMSVCDMIGVTPCDSAKHNVTGLQIKRGQIYNIRPLNFNGRTKCTPAKHKKRLLIELYRTLMKTDMHQKYTTWLSAVVSNYYDLTRHHLMSIKDVASIESKYQP